MERTRIYIKSCVLTSMGHHLRAEALYHYQRWIDFFNYSEKDHKMRLFPDRHFFKLIIQCLILTAFLVAECPAQQADTSVAHTLFLIGDAGEPYVKHGPLGKVLRREIATAGKNSTVLFLGDNVYPTGLPEKDSKKYPLAEQALQTQVDFVQGLETNSIFIPGNHDWDQWGKDGLEYIINQQQWIDSLQDNRITMLPRNGCPGPVQIPLTNKSILVILDTQWFLHKWRKPKDSALCNATTRREALRLVEDIFKNNPGKRILVAAHHPLITYGEHGGVFTWKAHIFPLEEITDYLYIPLPIIGSLYPLYRKCFGHRQDTAHPVYRKFSEPLQTIMARYPGSVYIAAHEHALQYIIKDSTHFIVSGSGAKTEFVRNKGDAVFARDIRGFTVLFIHADGNFSFKFIEVDKKYPDGRVVFHQRLLPSEQQLLPSFPSKE